MSTDDEFGTDEGTTDETTAETTDASTDETSDETTDGSTDEGTTDEGTTDEGTTDEGTTDEGTTDDSGAEDGTPTTDDTGTDDTSGTDDQQPSSDQPSSDEPSGDEPSGDEPTADTSETDATEPVDDTSGTAEPVDDTSSTDTSGADTTETTDDTSGSDPSGTDTSAPADDTPTSDTTTTGTVAEQGPPYLFADLYPDDAGKLPAWEKVAAAPNFVGVILKAWNGERYNDGGWFAANWPRVKAAGGDRYGTSWFRGSYLFLKFAFDGTKQANAYLDAIDKAGGWDTGDIIPAVDVEWDTYPPINKNSITQQIVDCVSTCNQRIHERTGKKIMLYGRTVLAERKITDHLNADLIWNPSYTQHPWYEGIETWDKEAMVLWQYAGDNKGVLPGHPSSVPGIRQCDVSVFTKGAQHTTLAMLRDSLL